MGLCVLPILGECQQRWLGDSLPSWLKVHWNCTAGLESFLCSPARPRLLSESTPVHFHTLSLHPPQVLFPVVTLHVQPHLVPATVRGTELTFEVVETDQLILFFT